MFKQDFIRKWRLFHLWIQHRCNPWNWWPLQTSSSSSYCFPASPPSSVSSKGLSLPSLTLVLPLLHSLSLPLLSLILVSSFLIIALFHLLLLWASAVTFYSHFVHCCSSHSADCLPSCYALLPSLSLLFHLAITCATPSPYFFDLF